jgi:hypothetical protein
MALTEFVIPPDQTSYVATDGNDVISTKLMGGASRYRRDLIGSTAKVTVGWTVGPTQFKYIRAFYNAVAVKGSLPFSIGLLLDEPEITIHKAYFVPGSMSHSSPRGLTYNVSAELEVYPAEISETAADYVYFYNEFGEAFPYWEDMLNTIVNISLPEDL